MFSNITISRSTVILTCTLLSANIFVALLLAIIGIKVLNSWGTWLIFFSTSLVVTYVILKYFIEYLVLGRIKLIYNMISDSKLSKSLKKGDTLHNLSLAKVNDEVIAWAENKESEITYLKELEDYRKSFLGNISHELKTPIFSAQGYIHTLLEGGLFDEKVNIKYLKRAASNIDRLQSIVEDLEEINLLQSGEIHLNFEVFNLKKLLVEVVNDLEIMAREEQISISYLNGVHQKYKVVGDRENIGRVLINLIGNAIKYGRAGGALTIDFFDLEDRVLVEIGDNGYGIEEVHLKHLFDRFYRIDTSRNRKFGGSGLGLSIVKHIIEAHNQTVSVRSTKNVGTTFGFTLKKH